MATLTPDSFANLVTATLDKYNKGKITDIAFDLQRHTGLKRIMSKKITFGGGLGYTFPIMSEYDANTRAVGYFAPDNISQVEGSVNGRMEWRNVVSGYTYDYRQQLINMNSEVMLLDFIKMLKRQMYGGFAAKMEQYFWGRPTSTADNETPWGIKYWLMYNATAGFNGGNNTNCQSSGAAGVDSDTYTNWANYTDSYTAVSKTDLIRKMRTARELTGFMSPMDGMPLSENDRGGGWEYITDYYTLQIMEETLEDQNMNLGNDVASKDGKVLFGGNPVISAPYLTTYESDHAPVIGINWATWRPVALQGNWMRMTPAKPRDAGHNIYAGHLDCSFNFLCENKRENFLIAKSDWN